MSLQGGGEKNEACKKWGPAVSGPPNYGWRLRCELLHQCSPVPPQPIELETIRARLFSGKLGLANAVIALVRDAGIANYFAKGSESEGFCESWGEWDFSARSQTRNISRN